MSNVVYSGLGDYDTATLSAVYNVYLPALSKGSYSFYTNKIYNLSSSAYPNVILLFMEIVGDDDISLSGTTTQPATEVTFSLAPNCIMKIDPACISLNTTQQMKVIVMHDDDRDTAFVQANYYNTWPTELGTYNDGKENAFFAPKKMGIGTMKPRPAN